MHRAYASITVQLERCVFAVPLPIFIHDCCFRRGERARNEVFLSPFYVQLMTDGRSRYTVRSLCMKGARHKVWTCVCFWVVVMYYMVRKKEWHCWIWAVLPLNTRPSPDDSSSQPAHGTVTIQFF
jgi:hypothetical protein